jgi:SAM-dependent methyltransferase
MTPTTHPPNASIAERAISGPAKLWLIAEQERNGRMSNQTAEAERIRSLYEKDAPKYDRQIGFFERMLFSGGRQWVCSQAEGDVLEIAIGMVEIARKRAQQLGREIDLRVGDAQALDFPDASFDTVVCTLALCTIADDRAAVSEVKRVLRPAGRFLLLEHVRSPVPAVRLGQRLLEPLMLRFEGDHLLREPLEHLRAEDLDVEQLRCSKLGIVQRIAASKPPQPS